MKLSQFLACVFVAALAVAVQILVMMLGWGLQPRSWWWIIGVGTLGFPVLRALADAVSKETK